MTIDCMMKVTIISETFTPDTTADGAAGIFGLYLLGGTDPDRQVTTVPTWWN